MKFENQNNQKEKIPMGNIGINFFDITPKYENNERKKILSLTSDLWKILLKKSGTKDFAGVVRFDLVPSFDKDNNLDISGVYEVNTGQPECPIAFAQIDEKLKNTNGVRPFKIISKKIENDFGKDINIMLGRNKLKDAWGNNFIKLLQEKSNLNVEKVTEEQAKKGIMKPTWRLGDFRLDGESHFSIDFTKWVSQQPNNNFFNTFCLNGNDPGNKKFLLNIDDKNLSKMVGKNKILNKENIEWAKKNKTNLVMKPNGGASGNGIFFGEHMSSAEWKQTLYKNLNSKVSYGLWEKKKLPSVKIAEKEMTLDLNPVFWAKGDRLEYLYTISRIMNSKKYNETSLINVAAGGGLLRPFK